MATVKLKNLQRAMRVFNLESPHFVENQGKNGRGKPESVTFLAHQTLELPEQVLECTEIKSALKETNRRRPTLRIVK